jgi:predicted enzyme related to lactoylglutathione lyase
MIIKHILTRIYVEEIESAISFYEKLTNSKCGIRFEYKQLNLELAQVGNFLIISGSEESLKPFRNTLSTIRVDSIDEFRSFLIENEAVILQDKKEVPTGFNMTVRHKDGSIFEYVEFK